MDLLLFMALPFPVIYLCLLPAALGGSQPLGPRRDRVAGRLPHGRIGLSPLLGGRTLTDGNRWHGPVDLLAVGGYALTAVPILVLAALTFRGGSARRPLRYGQRNSGGRA
jgi:hypothetical protein